MRKFRDSITATVAETRTARIVQNGAKGCGLIVRFILKERGMSEAIAFIAGLIAMAVVWFINDNSTSTSPYRRGFEDGYRKAMRDYEQKGSRNEHST